MKKPIVLLFTDTHLMASTKAINESIFNQAIQLAKELKITKIFHLGDWVESRKALPLDILEELGGLITLFKYEELEVITIPGNHCKVNYLSESSYLDEFRFHPNFTLFRNYGIIEEDNTIFHFIPYFDEKTTYLSYLQKVIIQKNKINILLTHVAINGVHNNDFQTVENEIGVNLFKQFDKVFVGHYHCSEQVGKNIYYIGSAYQAIFAEDDQKGFTIIYDDGSHEFIQSKFPKYITVKININNTSPQELDVLCQNYSNSEDNIRFEFSGTIEKLRAIDYSKIKSLGIDVKTKLPNVREGIILAQKDEFVAFNKTTLKSEFDKFIELNKLKGEKGKQYLEKMLN